MLNEYRVVIKSGDNIICAKPNYYGECLSVRKQMKTHFGRKASVVIQIKTKNGWVTPK